MSIVVQHLNIVLKNELTAINQYFLHGKMLQDMGYNKLAEHMNAESIDEMKHADVLCDRILLLKGLPNLQNLGKLNIGENPVEMLKCDLKLEDNAIKDLRKAYDEIYASGDVVSARLVEDILKSEEDHYDWIETQIGLVESLGEQIWLQLQV